MSKLEALSRRLCQEDNRHPDGHHDGCRAVCVHRGRDSVCPYLQDALAVIDELMEPGLDVVDDFVVEGMPKRFWQAILTAIKNGA